MDIGRLLERIAALEEEIERGIDARRTRDPHRRYYKFSDFGDAEAFSEIRKKRDRDQT
ncbi:hypothetical protein JCM17960_15320 [Magnetospira thiophila]